MATTAAQLPADFADPFEFLFQFAHVDPSTAASRRSHAKNLEGKSVSELNSKMRITDQAKTEKFTKPDKRDHRRIKAGSIRGHSNLPTYMTEQKRKVGKQYSKHQIGKLFTVEAVEIYLLSWWSKDTVAVVTGANKGCGFEIVRQLATKGITTILTSRDEGRGIAAVNELKSEGLNNVLYHRLDISSPESAAKLASWIKETVGGVDILVCNAGIALIEFNYEAAKRTLDTNYFGQKTIVSALLPLMRPSDAGARIVFVSSELGQLALLENEKVKEQLSDVSHLTEEDVDALVNKYLEDVKAGRQAEWTVKLVPQYNESKMFLNAYSRVLAKSLSSRPEGSTIYVNSSTPGFTATDINLKHPMARTVAEGVDTLVWISLYPSGGPTGGFFRDRADCEF